MRDTSFQSMYQQQKAGDYDNHQSVNFDTGSTDEVSIFLNFLVHVKVSRFTCLSVTSGMCSLTAGVSHLLKRLRSELPKLFMSYLAAAASETCP